MKLKTIKTIAFVSALVLGAALPARASETLRVNVPFPFILAGQEFSAGQYRVNQMDSGLIIVQGEGRAAAVLRSRAIWPGGPILPHSTSQRVTGANTLSVSKCKAKVHARFRAADSRSAS